MDRRSINAIAINVWQGSFPPETWSEYATFSREDADIIALEVERDYPPIRRVGIWNVRPKATDETKG